MGWSFSRQISPQQKSLARTPGFRFRVSDFRFQVSGFRFQVSGFGFQISGFAFRVSGSAIRIRVSVSLRPCGELHFGEFFFQKLLVIQVGVVTVQSQEFFVGAKFHDPAAVQDGNAVGVANR